MAKQKEEKFDLVVIGSGPGGYVAAIRAAQLGLKVACVERYPTLGGTCLNVGCIPSKALLESTQKYHECRTGMAIHGIQLKDVSFRLEEMMARKSKVVETLTSGIEYLFKKNAISRYTGIARLLSADVVEIEGEDPLRLEAEAILVATGSKVADIPGVKLDGVNVISSTDALSLEEVPNHLVVIGAGAIGLELGSVWRRLGAEVSVVEYFERVLPTADKAISKMCLRLFKKQGFQFHLGAKIETIDSGKDGCRVVTSAEEELKADKVLVAAGRQARLDGLGFADLGGRTDRRGFIVVDSNYQTSVPGIYAIGDVIGGLMLAHKAMEEGIACVEKLAGNYGHVNYPAVPSIVYTHPEIAMVGKTQESLEQENVDFRTGLFYFKGNGRALAMNESDGMVKIIAAADTDRILGVHIIGARAGDLLAEAVTAMEFSASSEDLGRCFHAHPTLAEAIKEASLNIGSGAIHG